MILEYVPRDLSKVKAVQWFPETAFLISDGFNPKIEENHGRHYLIHSTGHKERLESGWWIVYHGSILEYELWSEKEFEDYYVVASENS